MKPSPAIRRRWSTTIALLFLSSCAMAQGTFVNFETPQVKPMAIATLTSGATTKEFLLACNTPDNSVEIYEAAPPFAFIRRVPVGLGPVTVKWNAFLKRFYTCNFDGDSMSVVGLSFTGNPPVLTASLKGTTHVGDEPADLTFLGSGNNQTVRLTLGTRSSYVDYDALTAALLTPGGEQLIQGRFNPNQSFTAMKMPRRIEQLSDGRTMVLDLMGDTSTATSLFDLWINDPNLPEPTPVKGLGTTHYSFAVNSTLTRMFVVGTHAKNDLGTGVAAVSQLGTGFVQSRLWVVNIPAGSAPSVVAEAAGGAPPTLNYHSINLNRDYTVPYSGTPPLPAVAPALAISQPTDVVIVKEGVAGSSVNPTRLAVSMFQSDVVAFLTASTTTPGGWDINRVTIPLLNPAGGYSIGGPRGLVLSKLANGGNGYLFVSNRLDNSIVVIDPSTQAITAQFALANDPTPAVIRTGRKFLYHAGQTSGSRTVACGSCHVDGRTDGLAWDLGDPLPGPLLPPRLINFPGITDTHFRSEKGPIITQTLQGLVDWPVEEAAQVFMTNAPYHWRGDKSDIVEFNEAFVNLQGMTNLAPPGAEPRGITIPEMESYRAFINTIMHPPNPEQSIDRTMTGTMDHEAPNTSAVATGQLRGMILFHTNPHQSEAEMGRACVDCHALPDGSFNTLTDLIPVEMSISAPTVTQNHLFETAALRNVRQREMAWHPVGNYGTNGLKFTKEKGLAHDGVIDFAPSTQFSVNSFVQNPAFTFPSPAVDQAAVAEFLRKFDTGVAPMVGRAMKLPSNGASTLVPFEAQAKEANAGLVVFVRTSTAEFSYWYDVVNDAYIDAASPTMTTSRAALQAIAAGGDTVIAQAVPIGSERRIADPQGIDHPYHNLSDVPSAVALMPMAPNTANVHIAEMSGNLDGVSFPPVLGRFPLETMMDTVLGQFGMAATRHHQPPRRFRVTGTNIRYGAKLVIGLPLTPPPTALYHYIKLDIHPTKYKNPQNPSQTIFETHAEIDATMTMAFLNGGLFRSEVVDAYNLVSPPTLTFNPAWNSYMIGVEDEDGQIVFITTPQPLTVQNGR